MFGIDTLFGFIFGWNLVFGVGGVYAGTKIGRALGPKQKALR